LEVAVSALALVLLSGLAQDAHQTFINLTEKIFARRYSFLTVLIIVLGSFKVPVPLLPDRPLIGRPIGLTRVMDTIMRWRRFYGGVACGFYGCQGRSRGFLILINY
jgi:hypothetical protein